MSRILITGGAGFIGSLLVPTLLEQGHAITVFDWFMFGDHLPEHPHLLKIKGDVGRVAHGLLQGHDAVIHLACISNDPSFVLNPALGAADLDNTLRLVQLAKDAGVARFILASSSSVYGAKPADMEVTEDLALEPQTGYSTIKARCEEVVLAANGAMTTVALRPATVCGYAPRLRLDVVVNALTSQAYFNGVIQVQGGSQYRAHLHIRDMVRAYQTVLDAPADRVAGQVFNVNAENITILDLAQRVQELAGGAIRVDTKAVDARSYRLNTDKIAQALGFRTWHTIDEAIYGLVDAFKHEKVRDINNPIYYNVQQIQACHIS